MQERLIQAHALPNVSKPPTLLQPLSSSSRVMMIGLSSDELTPIEQSVIARWTIRPRLMGVPGVANVAVWGMRDQQLQVQVDPERLRDRDVTLSQVVSTAGNAQVVSPLTFLEASTPGTGGFIETPQQRLQVRNVLEQLADPDELGKVPVEGTGGRLRLSDVSDVAVDHQPLIGDAVVDGGEGLLLVVEKFPGANTLEVTEGVEDALEKLRPGLAGLQTDTLGLPPGDLHRGRDGQPHARDHHRRRAAARSPSSRCCSSGARCSSRWSPSRCRWSPPRSSSWLLGETINAISFAGLAIAVAVVVDEAVVGAESVARRLRERRAAGGGESTAAIVLEASAEVRSPLVYATLIALLAIVPVAVMEGRPGAFFEPLVLAYALAVVAAMLVALTVTPALSALLFSLRQARRCASPRCCAGRSRRYDRALGRARARGRARRLIAAGALRPRRARGAAADGHVARPVASRTATCSSGSTPSRARPTRA